MVLIPHLTCTVNYGLEGSIPVLVALCDSYVTKYFRILIAKVKDAMICRYFILSKQRKGKWIISTFKEYVTLCIEPRALNKCIGAQQ